MTFFRREGENPMKHFGSYLTIVWTVPNDVCDIWLSRENSFAIRFFFSVYTQLASQILFI